MTDMMTKKVRGLKTRLIAKKEALLVKNSAFALDGINQNVDIKWKVPDILPEYIQAYEDVKMMCNLKLKI